MGAARCFFIFSPASSIDTVSFPSRQQRPILPASQSTAPLSFASDGEHPPFHGWLLRCITGGKKEKRTV